MDPLEEYQTLKEEIEEYSARKSKLEGKLEGLTAKLKELGCKSVKDAKRLRKQKREEEQKLTEEFAEEHRKFTKKWKEKFDE